MDEELTLDKMLDVCGHKHRRIVLAALASREDSISIDDLTNEIIKHNHHTSPTGASDETVKQVCIGLYQVHLPKLAEAGFIRYDSERKVAEPTAKVGRQEPYHSAILAMDSELPVN